LLGGKARDRVPLAFGIYQRAPEEMAEEARQAVAEGYHAIELKVGRNESTGSACLAQASRSAGRESAQRLPARGRNPS
jgi:L-alanine-DL-glutamate epimerase-like enolase superfamily enzyme